MGCKTNNCVILLIYLLISICQCEAQDTSENPVVTLEYGNNTNAKYYVELNKSLQIIIKNSHAGYVGCYDYYEPSLFIFQRKDFPNYDRDSVINITRVTPEMSTRWCCTIYQRYHGPPQAYYKSQTHTASQFYFHIVVKGAQSVNASINGKHLNFTKMGLNVKHDGVTSFYFINGQYIEFVCANSDRNYTNPKRQTTVRIEYFNQNEEKIFEVPQINDDRRLLVRTKLTSTQDTFHMDCICYTNNPEREYRYRTYFYEKPLDYNPDVQDNRIRLSVNGLLQHYVRINGEYLEYPPFGYINGEVITVTCEAERENSNTSLQFYFHDKQVNNFKVYKKENKIVAILNSTVMYLNNKTLLCKDTNAKKDYLARMTFESDIDHIGPVIAVGVFGLPRENILYQYYSSYSWTTVYEYSPNENINLGCVLNALPDKTYRFEWNFNQSDGDSIKKLNSTYITGGLMKYSTENFTRKLTESDDKKVIKCIVYEERKKLNFAVVKLQLKNTSTPENVELAVKKESYGTILLYLVVCIAFTAIFVCTLIIIVWRIRAKKVKLLDNTYENLSNQAESPIPPYPPQWDENDHYSKIDEGVIQENCTYHRNDRTEKYPNLRPSLAPTENHYTEIDDYLKTPYKTAKENVNSKKKFITAPIKDNTYDTLNRKDKVNTPNTAIYGSADKNDIPGEQNVGNYENIDVNENNDNAYSYVYDTRVIAAKIRNKDKSASDYDSPYNLDEVNVDNNYYIGPETSKTNSRT